MLPTCPFAVLDVQRRAVGPQQRQQVRDDAQQYLLDGVAHQHQHGGETDDREPEHHGSGHRAVRGQHLRERGGRRGRGAVGAGARRRSVCVARRVGRGWSADTGTGRRQLWGIDRADVRERFERLRLADRAVTRFARPVTEVRGGVGGGRGWKLVDALPVERCCCCC